LLSASLTLAIELLTCLLPSYRPMRGHRIYGILSPLNGFAARARDCPCVLATVSGRVLAPAGLTYAGMLHSRRQSKSRMSGGYTIQGYTIQERRLQKGRHPMVPYRPKKT